MKDKRPARQWYWGDWKKDMQVQSLDYETRGIWFELLSFLDDSEERGRLVNAFGQSMADDAAAQLLGVTPEKWKQTRSKLLESGTASEDEYGVLYNRRMAREEALSRTRSKSGSAGGKASAASRLEAKAIASLQHLAEDEEEVVVNNDFKSKLEKGFDDFWKAYPKKVGKQEAVRRFTEAIANGARPQEIIDGAGMYAKVQSVSDTSTKHPSGWLNDERWKDELTMPKKPNGAPTAADIGAAIDRMSGMKS